MKIYTTYNPGLLFLETVRVLRSEGYLDHEIPDWWISDEKWVDRDMEIERDCYATGYYAVDFTLYTSERGHSIRSSHHPAHHTWRDFGQMSDVFAATFDQWGLFLGALFDTASDNGAPLRVVTYDWRGKNAAATSRGVPFPSSWQAFTHRTVGEYSHAARASSGVSLSCRNHDWKVWSDGISRCRKCDREHRFNYRRVVA